MADELQDVPEKVSFPEQEEQILALWQRIDAFQVGHLDPPSKRSDHANRGF
jgi:hypothetical protein